MHRLPLATGLSPKRIDVDQDEHPRAGRASFIQAIVFAVEYKWARRHLDGVRARARSAADKAAASRVPTASAVLFGIGAIGLGGVLIFTDVLPLSGLGTGASVAFGGLTVLATTAYSVRELRRAGKVGEIGPAQTGAAEDPGEP